MRAKKDVNTIIDKGTPRERINLYYSYRAERDRGITPPLLTKEEISRLMESFKTSREIALFDRYININRDVQKTIIHLNQLQLSYREQIAYLRGIDDIMYAFIDNAKLLNKILQRVKDEDVKEEILNDIVNHPAKFPLEYIRDGERIMLKVTRPGQEGLSDIEYLVTTRKALAERALKNAKTILKAIRDYMREKGFKIKVYQNQLKAIEQDLIEDKAISGLFSKRKIAKRLATTKSPLTAELIKEIIANYSEWLFYPTYNEIELDEEMYKDYRETYFHE